MIHNFISWGNKIHLTCLLFCNKKKKPQQLHFSLLSSTRPCLVVFQFQTGCRACLRSGKRKKCRQRKQIPENQKLQRNIIIEQHLKLPSLLRVIHLGAALWVNNNQQYIFKPGSKRRGLDVEALIDREPTWVGGSGGTTHVVQTEGSLTDVLGRKELKTTADDCLGTKSHRLVIKKGPKTRLGCSHPWNWTDIEGNAATQRAVGSDYYYYFKINRLFSVCLSEGGGGGWGLDRSSRGASWLRVLEDVEL